MRVVYCILFWIFTALTLFFTAYCFKTNNFTVIKEFSLPLLAIIFTIGQLWQKEKQLEFENRKYIQSRKDLYFDKRVEIILAISKFFDDITGEIIKPIFNDELNFDHKKYFFMRIGFYCNIVTKARFLFDDEFIKKIDELSILLEKITDEIQRMQTHLILSKGNKEHENYKFAMENYAKYYKELQEKYSIFLEVCTKQINTKDKL